MELKEHLDVVREALATDEGYFFGWQSNIAMAFLDELSRRGFKLPYEHDIANQAAKNFLTILVGDKRK
jgi:hypothetical protein